MENSTLSKFWSFFLAIAMKEDWEETSVLNVLLLKNSNRKPRKLNVDQFTYKNHVDLPSVRLQYGDLTQSLAFFNPILTPNTSLLSVIYGTV